VRLPSAKDRSAAATAAPASWPELPALLVIAVFAWPLMLPVHVRQTWRLPQHLQKLVALLPIHLHHQMPALLLAPLLLHHLLPAPQLQTMIPQHNHVDCFLAVRCST